MLRPIKYFKELYLEIKVWRQIKKIAIESKEDLAKENFRVDWVGRIYTVINLPEEMMDRPDLHEGFVLMQLRDYDSLFMKMGIADYIFPEISNVGDGAYLLVLTGPKDYIGVVNFIKHIIGLGLYILLLRILYSVAVNNWPKISELWKNLMNLN